MRNKITGVLLLVLVLGFSAYVPSARADGDQPAVDELTETKLDAEIQGDDNQEIKYDNQYVGEQEKITKKELADTKHQADSLRAKNEAAQVQIKSKWDKLNQEKQQTKDAMAELEKNQNQLKDSQAKFAGLNNDLSQLKNQRESIARNNKAISADLIHISKENAELTRQNSKLQKQIDVASHQLKELRARHDRVVATNHVLRGKVHKRQASLHALHMAKTKVAKRSRG